MNNAIQTVGKPPKTLGILLGILGLFLVGGGLWLMSKGASAYFLAIGIGLLISGVLLAMAKKAGFIAYSITFGVIVVWSFLETGLNMPALLPRIILPLIIAIYLAQPKVRETLI